MPWSLSDQGILITMKTVLLAAYAITTTLVASLIASSDLTERTALFYSIKAAALFGAIIYFFRKGYLAKFKFIEFDRFSRFLLVIWSIFFLLLPVININSLGSWKIAVISLFYTSITALFEEVTFRVIPFPPDQPESFTPFRIAKYSAIFGIAHAGNILYTGSLTTTLSQIIIAFGYGLLFTIALKKTRSLLYIFLLHLFVNLPQEYIILLDQRFPTIETQAINAELSPAPIVFSATIAFILWLISYLWQKN